MQPLLGTFALPLIGLPDRDGGEAEKWEGNERDKQQKGAAQRRGGA
jgi:hypothetical protein